MRVVLVGLAALGMSACAYGVYDQPRQPRMPEPQSNSGITNPYERDKIPDTPYEVRKAEMERDEQIAGKGGPSYPKLFKNQKDEGDGS